jgi:hypothetical protein
MSINLDAWDKKRYIVGWVRFFCKAKKRHPTERDKCWGLFSPEFCATDFIGGY